MRIVGLVQDENHVCSRYRLRAFAAGFAALGHTLELRPLGRGLQRWRTLGSVGDADVVVLQRKLLSPWELPRLRRHARRLIFDFDDAVFLRDSYHPRGSVSMKLARRFAATVAAADAVVAGNEWLADRAGRVGARCLAVIPTCIDVVTYPMAAHRAEAGLTLVWVGSSSTLQGLWQHRALLEHLGQSIPNLTLRLICDRTMRLTQLRVDHRPWAEAGERDAIADGDVGLSILPDDAWSRGKCGLKLLQYLAAGLPVIGNPVGVTSAIIGEAGYLATSNDEWISALQRLRDPEHRRLLGAIGRQQSMERFGIAVGLHAWRQLLDEAAMRRAG